MYTCAMSACNYYSTCSPNFIVTSTIGEDSVPVTVKNEAKCLGVRLVDPVRFRGRK